MEEDDQRFLPPVPRYSVHIPPVLAPIESQSQSQLHWPSLSINECSQFHSTAQHSILGSSSNGGLPDEGTRQHGVVQRTAAGLSFRHVSQTFLLQQWTISDLQSWIRCFLDFWVVWLAWSAHRFPLFQSVVRSQSVLVQSLSLSAGRPDRNFHLLGWQVHIHVNVPHHQPNVCLLRCCHCQPWSPGPSSSASQQGETESPAVSYTTLYTSL